MGAVENTEEFHRALERQPPTIPIFTIEQLFPLFEALEITYPYLVAWDTVMAPGESGSVRFSLPPGWVCIQRIFEMETDDPPNVEFSWSIDGRLTVPRHSLVPNTAINTERSPFGKYWIKYHYLDLSYWNLDTTYSHRLRMRAWAQLTELTTLREIIFPLYARYLMWFRLPIAIPPVPPGSSSIEPNYQCKICLAKAKIDFDAKQRKVEGMEWGSNFHHGCPLTSLPLNKDDWDRAVDQGLILEVK